MSHESWSPFVHADQVQANVTITNVGNLVPDRDWLSTFGLCKVCIFTIMAS
jgi:hypothetical protein